MFILQSMHGQTHQSTTGIMQHFNNLYVFLENDYFFHDTFCFMTRFAGVQERSRN